MIAFFLIVLAVPMLVAGASFVFLKGITWKEFLCQVAAQLAIAGISAAAVSCSVTHDTEIWNGRVTKKYSEHVSCSHSYECHCHTVRHCSGSGKNRSCSSDRECDTCYEHSYDVDWVVEDSIGDHFRINRVDRQGLSEPPRYSSVVMGEPTSTEKSYDNYVKASPGTLFRHQGLVQKYAASMLNEPQDVYDYYRLDHLVTMGVAVDDPRAWNRALADVNADLGSPKQANLNLVLVRNQPPDWYYALEERWIGGKKNDVNLVVSVDNDMKPQWAAVMCWTTSELFKVKLRDDVMNDAVLTRDAVVADLRTNVSQYFQRKPMSDFKYLEAEMQPTATGWVVTLVIGLLVAGGLAYLFETQDVFGDEVPASPKRYLSASAQRVYPSSSSPLDAFLPWYRRPFRSRKHRAGTHSGGPL